MTDQTTVQQPRTAILQDGEWIEVDSLDEVMTTGKFAKLMSPHEAKLRAKRQEIAVGIAAKKKPVKIDIRSVAIVGILSFSVGAYAGHGSQPSYNNTAPASVTSAEGNAQAPSK